MKLTICKILQDSFPKYNSLEETPFMSPSQTLGDLTIGEDSEPYDVCLDDSFLDKNSVIPGVTYRNILDSEEPSFEAFGFRFRRLIFRIDKDDNGNYCFKSNGRVVLLFEYDERNNKTLVDDEVKKKIKDAFSGCVDDTCAMLKTVAQELLMENANISKEKFEDEYGKILHERLDEDSKTDWKKNVLRFWDKGKKGEKAVEFNNFREITQYAHENQYTIRRVPNIKWDKLYNRFWLAIDSRNKKSHDYTGEATYKLGQVEIIKRVQDLQALTLLFNDTECWNKLNNYLNEINDLFSNKK